MLWRVSKAIQGRSETARDRKRFRYYIEHPDKPMSRDYEFMRRCRQAFRRASKLPGPRLESALDIANERSCVGTLLLFGFDGPPLCVKVNALPVQNEFVGQAGAARVDSRNLWAVVKAARLAEGIAK